MLRVDARGHDVGVCQELAAGIGRVLINAQIAAPLKTALAIVVDQAYNST